MINEIIDLVKTGINKFLPDRLSEAEKDEIKNNMQQFLITKAIESDSNFRRFLLEYEGRAKDMPLLIQIVRALVRPVITFVITGAYTYGWLNPEVFTPSQMSVLKPALLIVLIFWFGEKALAKSGIIDVLKGKGGNKRD